MASNQVNEIVVRLSKAQREEMSSALPGTPGSIHDYDRNSEEWIRMTKKPVAEALHRKGLVGQPREDYPCGGYRAELTDLGKAVRRHLRGEDEFCETEIARIEGGG